MSESADQCYPWLNSSQGNPHQSFIPSTPGERTDASHPLLISLSRGESIPRAGVRVVSWWTFIGVRITFAHTQIVQEC